MQSSVFALSDRQHGLVTRRQLVEAGTTDRDVRRLVAADELVRLRRGVFVRADVWGSADVFRDQPLLRMRAASLVLQAEDYVFSHDSAAIALGLGAPDPRTAAVHISRRKVHGDALRADVKHHLAPYTADDIVQVAGLDVLDHARTALDMAREHGRAHGLAACDAAMRHGVSRTELEKHLTRMSCWPHSRCMRWCVDHADGASESYLESLGRDFVLELGIGRPQCQFGLTDGDTTAFADIRVGRHYFEVDGLTKYVGADGRVPLEVLVREKARSDFLAGFKLGSSRLTHHDLHAGRASALRRVAREYADTCTRFGTSVEDLAAYRVARRRTRRAG